LLPGLKPWLQFADTREHCRDDAVAPLAVETEGVEPTAHPLPLSNIMRSDSVTHSLSQEEALANAPRVEDGYFRVRAVLE